MSQLCPNCATTDCPTQYAYICDFSTEVANSMARDDRECRRRAAARAETAEAEVTRLDSALADSQRHALVAEGKIAKARHTATEWKKCAPNPALGIHTMAIHSSNAIVQCGRVMLEILDATPAPPVLCENCGNDDRIHCPVCNNTRLK